MELISVIVPAYQVANYLEKCVNSIRQQTYTNLEILLVDDGSSDGSAQLCDKLAGEDARIVVIHKKKEGVSVARNVGIAKETGEYICFCDADDYIEKDMYGYLLHLLHSHAADVAVCSGWYEYGPNSSRPFETAKEELVLSGEEALLDAQKKVSKGLYLQQNVPKRMFGYGYLFGKTGLCGRL